MTDHPNDKVAADAIPEEVRALGAQGWLQVLRLKLGLTGPQSLRGTLEDALKSQDPAAAFSDAERGMLERLLRFGASRVASIMVPRADIIALDENEPLSELLGMFDEAGISRLAKKARLLHSFLRFVIEDAIEKNNAQQNVFIITPKEENEHGCQISMLCKKNGKQIHAHLTANGIVADWREPEVLRMAPVPLYNSFEDVFRFGEMFSEALSKNK